MEPNVPDTEVQSVTDPGKVDSVKATEDIQKKRLRRIYYLFILFLALIAGSVISSLLVPGVIFVYLGASSIFISIAAFVLILLAPRLWWLILIFLYVPLWINVLWRFPWYPFSVFQEAGGMFALGLLWGEVKASGLYAIIAGLSAILLRVLSRKIMTRIRTVRSTAVKNSPDPGVCAK